MVKLVSLLIDREKLIKILEKKKNFLWLFGYCGVSYEKNKKIKI
jgi:hypothetical protein